MSGSQKAVVVEEIGKPVRLSSRKIPVPAAGQVLVKVTATMLLPHDTYGRDTGLLVDQRLPGVLGNNVAGVIESAGPEVNFRVRERVFGISSDVAISSDQAGLQEYAVLNANAIARVPEGFLDEQVVSLPINLVTSTAVLFTKTGFEIPAPYGSQASGDNSGTSVTILGGGTNVGQFAVQLAHLAGIGKIVVVAGAANNEKLRSMGATHVLDRKSSPADVAQEINTIIGPDNATQVYNCGPLDVDLAVRILSATKPSRLRSLLPLEEYEADRLKTDRPQCQASFVDDLTNESLAPHAADFWAKVPQWLRDGKILPAEYRVVDGLEKVDEINAALDRYTDFSGGAQTVVKIRG